MENPYEAPKTKSEQESPPVRSDFDRALYEIKREASNAMACAVAGLLFWIVAPAAVYFGRRTLKLIAQHGRGDEYENKAKRAISIGYVGIFVFALFALVVIGSAALAVFLPGFDASAS